MNSKKPHPASNSEISKKIEGILTQRESNGEYTYTQTEVRDFIAACIFMLGLPMAPQLRGTCEKFLADTGVAPDADNEAIIEALKEYFEKRPLNPVLIAQFNELARGEMFGDKIDVDAGAAGKNRQLLTKGQVEGIKAPSEGHKAGPTVTARRGL